MTAMIGVELFYVYDTSLIYTKEKRVRSQTCCRLIIIKYDVNTTTNNWFIEDLPWRHFK